MKQLVQTLKNGKIQIIEVPPPIINKGMIMVKNHYSLISPGTEGSTVRVARKSMVGKAKERPDQLKQVLEVLKRQGPIQTYRAVKQRLDAYSPLGYSCAGEVIDVSADIKGFGVGDMVACGGGGYANHAEIVAVPHNLSIKLPSNAELIGLGLIGQLTCLLLRAGGIKVIGVDIDSKKVDIAREHCVDFAYIRNEAGLERKIEELSGSIGADSIIITASSKSLDPINFAGRIARKKARVVIVGDVMTGFNRENYYKKELELRMSCSYGPGRYDINYEEKGIDYPVGYVRWTEKRNMEAFQELIHSGKINIDYLTTHVFDIQEAQKAYELILKKKEPYLGILIRYNKEKIDAKKKIEIKKIKARGKINIGFIGVGNYATNFLLPNIPKNKDAILKGVMDANSANAATVARKYGFEFCTSNINDILLNEEINTVFIATRHNTHAEYVIKCLKAGKNVYVEKPLCLKEEELEEIKDNLYSLNKKYPSQFLTVGFNRRFSPLTEILKKQLGEGPMAMIYRINAGYIPPESWIQDKDIGGGRIIGEVCHFVDYLAYLNGSLPEYVFASALPDSNDLEDTVNINLKFKNGSTGIISYFSNGSKSLFKEYIEVYKSGMVCILKDFKKLEIYKNGKKVKKRLLTQDKGQKSMIKSLLYTIKSGTEPIIGFEDIYAATKTTFKIIESIKNQQNQRI